ncbi:MAG TPA: SDR family oxidoreductase [Caulobacteraceae bacterium]|nr:SDR family oxidoreductase [Caulobacteraceae bacterium]
MRVLVVGGYGLIGGYVTARLHREGCQIVGAGRDIAVAARRAPYASWVMVDLRQMGEAARWAHLLVGVDAVVNCAGALQDSPRDDLAAVHVQAIRALAEACAAAGVRRVVHISAAGLGGSETRFSTTKREAEALLAATDLDWVILRPALVLAPAAYGGSALLRGLAAFPGFIPALYPDRVVQVVSAEDVAEAVARCLRPGAAARIVVDLAAAEATRLGDVLVALRAWLGLAPAPVLALPALAGRLAALAADILAVFGWRSPMRSTSLAQLDAGVEAGGATAEAALRFTPTSLSEMLASWPSGVQERWFARLYFLKPVGLAALIGFWLASGVVGLTVGRQHAAALLAPSLSPPLAHAAVVVGAVLDIGLAALALFRRTTPTALKGMIAVTVAYLASATIVRPELWADPLGPLVKTVPAAVLALVMLAVMSER